MDFEPVSFLRLPVELVCTVLDFLSVHDLLQCNLVCRRLRRIISESSALQFTIELSRYCMRSTLSSHAEPSFSSRLKILQEREWRWRTLSPKSRNKLKLAHSATVYEFSGGLYGAGKETDRRTGFITFYDLPSVESGEQRSHTYTFTDIHIVDFTMDPAQDLLILVVFNHDSPFLYDLHFRTLSTNEPHPSASSPILPCYKRRIGLDLSDSTVRIQISDDVVGFLLKEEPMALRGHFRVIKWRSPMPNSCTVNGFSGIDDFTFLSKDHFLLVRPNGLFEVYSFSDPISDPPTLKARYALPTLSDAYCYWYISLSSNPSPGYSPGTPGEKKIYYCSPSDRLHACSVYVFQPTFTDRDTVYPFVFFFHPKTFLNPPLEWQEFSRNAHVTAPFPLSNSPSTESQEAAAQSPSASSRGSPAYSASPSSRSSSSPPHSRTPSSASSVSLEGSSQHIINFPAPQATHTGPSSMLFDVSPSASSRATTASPASRSPSPVLPIPWEVWGPQNTRWFRDCLSKDWQRSIYGLRAVDCVLDRTASEELIHRNSIGPDDDSDDEDEDGDETGDDSLIFINDVAVSAGDIESHMGLSGTLPKFLRMRDFNPYSIAKTMDELAMDDTVKDPPSSQSSESPISSSSPCDGSGIRDVIRDRGGYRRVVTTASKTNARGVFRKNIISCLPYVEVISEEAFNVNEVMIDDSRLLLLRRGRRRKLKSIDILSM
ncbi:hypothetical protein GYMLUDRAFT_36043 [Collybiopsis luxurians FD-317 M1]|nr:hypothetical protein GYMLUDRAFT_36043 [Collybiopsis luxurians FD-317 M1]